MNLAQCSKQDAHFYLKIRKTHAQIVDTLILRSLKREDNVELRRKSQKNLGVWCP